MSALLSQLKHLNINVPGIVDGWTQLQETKKINLNNSIKNCICNTKLGSQDKHGYSNENRQGSMNQQTIQKIIIIKEFVQ